MPDVSSIIAAIGVAKDAITIAKSVIKTTRDSDVKVAISDLLEQLIETRSLMLNAQEELQGLQQQLSNYQKWDIEVAKYDLREPYPGTLVYARNEESRSNEPMHYLCPVCFEGRSKSYLQDGGNSMAQRICFVCDKVYQFRDIPNYSQVEV